MSDPVLKSIKNILSYQHKPKQDAHIDMIHKLSLENGKKAKRTIDAARRNQQYYIQSNIYNEVLDKYENIDWWERDTRFDFARFER